MADNTEPAGLAAYVLVISMLDHFVRAGLLPAEQQDEIFDAGLLMLEQLQGSASASQAETFQRARSYLEAHLLAVAQRRKRLDQEG